MTQATDKLIEKLQKLLALAERGGTEAEADAAMQKVQQLLTEHNLSMADIQEAQDKDEKFAREDSDTFEWNASWIPVVYRAVGELYFCQVWSNADAQNPNYMTMVGKPVNTYSALYVARIIVANGKKLAKEYAQHAYREYGMNAVSASNNFKKGYAQRIRERCWKMMAEAKKGNVRSETGKALVVGDFYAENRKAVEAFTRDVLKVKLHTVAGMKGAGDAGAAKAGSAAADKQNLTANGIGSNGEKALYIGSK